MRLGLDEQHSLNLAVALLAAALLPALAACGTLEVSLDQTPGPAQVTASPQSGEVQSDGTEKAPAPAATQEPLAGWGPLMPYAHPSYGYELLVPENAEVIEPEPGGRVTTFSDQRLSGESPSYLITVAVLPADGQSTGDLLALSSSDESDVSDVQAVEMAGGDATGALVTYGFGPSPLCPEMRPLLAALVDRDTGYVITVFSNGPGRCEAIHVPEALAIVESFRPPVAPAVFATPTPTPAAPPDELTVVFTRDNNAWLWTKDGGERQLTKDGGVDQVLMSEDKRVVAFRRGNGIWAVNADGSGERQLVMESDLPVPQEAELAGSITGMTINQLAWIPGTHQLLFNTMPQLEGPGLLLSDDLWRVDADGSSLVNLFPPGQGGNFAIAPDGLRLALVTPDSISMTTTAGEEKQQIFSYTPVITYSEFRYYARPVWSPQSDALGVVIPPPDRLATDDQAYGIWLLPTDGTPARLAGTIAIKGALPLPEPVINPNLDSIAYLSSSEVAPERADLLFLPWDETIGDPTFYTSWVDSFYDWSPGGDRFSFSRPPSEIAAVSVFTGRLDEEPRPVGDGESAAIDVRWIDDESYLFLQASARGWDLLLSDASGMITPVAAVVGQPPAFDVQN